VPSVQTKPRSDSNAVLVFCDRIRFIDLHEGIEMEYLTRLLWLACERLFPGRVVAVLFFSGLGATLSADPDTLFTESKALTAADLVSEVMVRNPEVQARIAAWEAVRTKIEQRRSLQDPRISYAISPKTIGSDQLDSGHVVSISQALPWPGKLDLRADVARLESDSLLQDVELTKLMLVEATRIAYADWYFVHAAIGINKINYSLLQEFQNIAEIKYAAGMVSKQDALNAEVEKLLLQHRDILLDSQRLGVQAVINTLLLRQPDLTLPLPADLPVLNQLFPPAKLRDIARQVHPDLISLQARLQASMKRQRLARRDFYPDFSVKVGYNSLWDNQEKRFTVGAGINIPLRGRRHAYQSETHAESIRIDAEYQARAAQVVGLVQQGYDRVRESEHIMALYGEKLVPLADENLQAAQSDYESGEGNFLDLLVAEKNLMQTRLQLEAARADHFRRLSSLERSVGSAVVFPVTPVMSAGEEKQI
jgi:outer membrane protein, heavy metal efflux system